MRVSRNILMLALPRHDEKFNSTSWQLATSLAVLGNTVFYVDHPYSWVDFVRNFYKGSMLRALFHTFFPSWKEVEGVWVLPPVLFLPVNFLNKGRLYTTINRWNQKRLSAIIDKQLLKRRIGAFTLINSFNFYLNEVHRMIKSPAQFIYHCIDPMIKAYTKKHGESQEMQLAEHADKIIVTAPALARKFIHLSKPLFYVSNAANVERCRKALSVDTQPDLIISKLRRPVMGYLGNIERRIDYSLLLKAVDLLPEWNLVLVGPSEQQYIPREFSNHPRIHLLPPVDQGEIPSVLKSFDVALIPFKVDQVSNGIYPLKLYEYMAAGLPVVTTSFNRSVLDQLAEPVIYTGDDGAAYAEKIQQSFLENNQVLMDIRVSVAEENTWEKRANDFLEIIENKSKCLVS